MFVFYVCYTEDIISIWLNHHGSMVFREQPDPQHVQNQGTNQWLQRKQDRHSSVCINGVWRGPQTSGSWARHQDLFSGLPERSRCPHQWHWEQKCEQPAFIPFKVNPWWVIDRGRGQEQGHTKADVTARKMPNMACIIDYQRAFVQILHLLFVYPSYYWMNCVFYSGFFVSSKYILNRFYNWISLILPSYYNRFYLKNIYYFLHTETNMETASNFLVPERSDFRREHVSRFG